MTQTIPHYIAVDIAKDSLQLDSGKESLSIPYHQQGLSTLIDIINKHSQPRVVCEATGGYERKLLDTLYSNEIEVALMNPSLVRNFARSQGIKAKTDPIDAKMLLRFALQKQPKATQAPEPLRQELAALMDRRSHLTEQLAREKNRLEKSVESLRASIEEMIEFVQEAIQAIDSRISDLIESDQQMQNQAELMQTVKGVGQQTAWTILAYFNEITQPSVMK